MPADPSPFIFDNERLADWLLSARKALGFSSRELAARAAVSSSQILRCESGEYGYSVEVLTQLCRELSLPVGALLESCIYPNFQPYLQRLKVDSLLTAQAKSYGLESKAQATVLPYFVANCAALMEQLLLSSNPCRWARAIEFPLPRLQHEILSYAEFIETNFDVGERFEQRVELKTDAFRYLHSRGVCDDAMLAEVAKLELFSVLGWKPFTKVDLLRKVDGSIAR